MKKQALVKNIKTLAEKAGLELTDKGNLELGRDNQGSLGTPGSQAYNSAVAYYLILSTGDVRTVIDNRSGSNQGYIEWHHGDVTRMDGADLDDAIQLAKEHVESLDDVELTRAWRIASSEARATMRKLADLDDTEDSRSPLADVSEFRVRLIAQAPAMLNALKLIVDAHTLECNPTEVQRRINVAVELIRDIEQSSLHLQ